jgi:hypothetical protein
VVPAAGAGNLETMVSEDDYTFTTTATQTITVDMQSCPTNMQWWLLNGAGTTVASGMCADATVTNAPAGNYRIVIKPYGAYIGTYKFAVTAT